ncbi:MAG: PIN domain protein [Candidatus Sumerlaeota bacterium]|nr:PIN domain protein [Candidatus Sumerlaeota bacterium]
MSKIKIYFDNCCYNRPFDDQSQLRIKLETEAKLAIQRQVKTGQYALVWSFMLSYENSQNPYDRRREQIAEWKALATDNLRSTPELLNTIRDIKRETGVNSADTVHLAAARYCGCDYFLTTDLLLLRKAKKLHAPVALNPLDFIQLMEMENEK